jgi:hypothetical protein
MTTLLEPTWAERFALIMMQMDGGPKTGLGNEAELDEAGAVGDKDDDKEAEGTKET